MKKRIASLFLVATMAMTMLAGCGANVTAESLIEGFAEAENVEYKMEAVVDISMDDYDMKMVMSSKVEASKEVAHSVSTVEYEVSGYSDSLETETYQKLDDDVIVSYGFDSYYEEWSEEETDAAKGVESLVPQITIDMFDEDELEMEKTDDGYEVTGLLVEIGNLAGADETSADMFGELMDDVEVKATLVFNEDAELEEMEFVYDVDEDEEYDFMDESDVTINEVSITYKIKSLDGDEVEIPDDVLEEVASSDDDDDNEVVEEEDDDDDTEAAYVESGKICTVLSPDSLYFTVDGVDFVIGQFGYYDFVDATSFYCDDYDYTEGDEYFVNKGSYESVDFSNGDYEYAYLYFKNDTNSALDITECTVASFSLYSYSDNPDYSVCGIPAGATIEEVIDYLGQPTSGDTYSSTDYLYYYFDNSYDSWLSLTFEDGVLQSFSVEYNLY